jgi:hypothetical protein
MGAWLGQGNLGCWKALLTLSPFLRSISSLTSQQAVTLRGVMDSSDYTGQVGMESRGWRESSATPLPNLGPP